MKKYVVFIIMCLVVLAGCAAAAGLFGGLGFESTVVSLRIDAGEENVLFDGDVTVAGSNPTAYMALKTAAGEKGLPLEINAQDTPDIMFLNGIGGIASEDPKYWILQVNGEKAAQGLGTEPVRSGDRIEFIYQNRNI